MHSTLRSLFTLSLVALVALLMSSWCAAQTPASASGGGTSTATPGAGFAVTSEDVTQTLNNLRDTINQITGSLINSATTKSSALNTESDKIAGGLAVLVIVLTFIEFAGTHHPVSAWVKVFRSLMVLGIFASVYVGYSKAAPGFYNWFSLLASDLSGKDIALVAMGKAAGSVLVGIYRSTDGVGFTDLANIPKLVSLLVVALCAVFCLVIIILSAVIFLYYTLIGVVQSAIGIVFGKIAIALGFHQMTRNFFMSWLSFMIHAGMYVAVSAAMNALIIQNFIDALSSNTPSGTLNFATSFASVISITLISLFILLLSLEIPRIAGMFGSGASGGPAIAKNALTAMTLGAFG
jgi:type IV secretory pathway VirB6-like protein